MRTFIAAVAIFTFANPALASVVVRKPHADSKNAEAKSCQHSITLARAAADLPPVEPNSTSDEPLLIAAVAKTIDGCPVLVMANDPSDIRPMPKSQDGQGKLQPLTAQ